MSVRDSYLLPLKLVVYDFEFLRTLRGRPTLHLNGKPFDLRAITRRLGKEKGRRNLLSSLRNVVAPQVGLEPTTLRLTAECSAIELLRSI
jgi:hypothetical protein